MERVSNAAVYALADIVSSRMPGLRVDAQRRSGYMALDLCDDEGSVVRGPLITGTAGEVHLYLRGMEEALDILELRVDPATRSDTELYGAGAV
jgi:hypothetical protein